MYVMCGYGVVGFDDVYDLYVCVCVSLWLLVALRGGYLRVVDVGCLWGKEERTELCLLAVAEKKRGGKWYVPVKRKQKTSVTV